MSYSYDPTLPDNRNKVRFALGDTNEARKLVEDEEIDALLITHVNIYKTCAAICDSLAARFAREEQIRTSNFGSWKSTLSEKYARLANKFRHQGVRTTGFIVSSITTSDKALYQDDTSLVQPFAKRGLHDNPDAVNTSDEL